MKSEYMKLYNPIVKLYNPIVFQESLIFGRFIPEWPNSAEYLVFDFLMDMIGITESEIR